MYYINYLQVIYSNQKLELDDVVQLEQGKTMFSSGR